MLTIIKKLSLIFLAAVLMALTINIFVYTGGIIPGGFTGIAILTQEAFIKFFNIAVPFSVILFTLNAIPAVYSYFYIGKRLTMYSVLMIFLAGIMTDLYPILFPNSLHMNDPLLCAVFGGILIAISSCLCLYADATGGGTDFIAIGIAEKYKKDAWNYIFMGNCIILIIAAFMFTLDKALYSIILQFTATVTLKYLYTAYQKKTLFIITNKPQEVYELIRDEANHDATSFVGTGLYQMAKREMLYSVVSANQSSKLIRRIMEIDPGAFINVMSTDSINGKFFKPPRR